MCCQVRDTRDHHFNQISFAGENFDFPYPPVTDLRKVGIISLSIPVIACCVIVRRNLFGIEPVSSSEPLLLVCVEVVLFSLTNRLQKDPELSSSPESCTRCRRMRKWIASSGGKFRLAFGTAVATIPVVRRDQANDPMGLWRSVKIDLAEQTLMRCT
jgi:hypothetical protein